MKKTSNNFIQRTQTATRFAPLISVLGCENSNMKIVSTEKKVEASPKEKIKSIGLAFLAFGLACAPVLFFVRQESKEPIFTYFIVSQMTILIATGIGAYCFKKWGYYLLLVAANIMSLGFPIGIYGIKLYRFLKLREVKKLFGVQSAETA